MWRIGRRERRGRGEVKIRAIGTVDRIPYCALRLLKCVCVMQHQKNTFYIQKLCVIHH